MDSTDCIRKLLREIPDTEQRLDGIRDELQRLVEAELVGGYI